MKESVQVSSLNKNEFLKDSELPDGWRLAYLGDVCTKPQYGWTTSSENNISGLKILRTSDISSGQIDWSTVPVCKEEPEDPEKFLLKPGDILISRAGSVGTSFIIKDCPRAVFASYLIRFRTLPFIETSYLGLFLKSNLYWDSIAGETIGITIPNVNASKLKQIQIPLPPLSEQHRIVARVEALLSQINAARDRLNRVPLIMMRFRQAVLAAACSGRLTEGWREEHPDVESATELLKKIQNENKVKLRKNIESTFSSIFEIPNTWVWTSIENLLKNPQHLSYGILKPGNPDPEGVPMIRVLDIGEWGFNNTKVVRVSQVLASQYERTKLDEGDILLAVMATVGRAIVVPPSLRGANVNRALAVIKLHSLINPQYACNVIRSPYFQKLFSTEKIGSAQARINISDLREMPFSLPPNQEQYEIVRRVETLLALADQIEHEVAEATTRTEALTQAVLAKAFRGELV